MGPRAYQGSQKDAQQEARATNIPIWEEKVDPRSHPGSQKKAQQKARAAKNTTLGGEIGLKGAPREPKGGPTGGKSRQKGSQETAKSRNKRFRNKSKNMLKLSEGRAKIDVWKVSGGAKGMTKTRKKIVERREKRIERPR